MVHTTSAIAVAVLALKAGSVLAAPSYEYSDEIAARDYDDYELEARDFDFEVDARDVDFEDIDARDFGEYEVDARDFDDFEAQEARELLDNFEDVDAREFDFGDIEEREVFDFVEDIVERAPASSTSTSSTATPTTAKPTTTTITVKPTGKAKNQKETKTVVVTTHANPKSCKKPSAISRLKNFFRKKRESRRKRSQIRAARRKHLKEIRDKKNGKSSSSSSTTSTSTSTSSSTTSTATATTTLGSEWAQITPPPRQKVPKGVRYSQKKSVGKDKITTISRTVTAAPTPCPTNAKKSNKKFKREVEDFEDIFGREYEVDELD